MATSERKYSNITFDSVRNHLLTILRAKGGKLADFGDSSYGRAFVDIMAGNTDLMAYYAESSFENSFLESAFTDSAIYAGSRMLGYSVRRPVPSKAGLGVQLTKTGIYDTVRVMIPRGTTFQLNSVVLTALSEMEFTYDRNKDPGLTGLMSLSSGAAVIAEGLFKSYTFISTGEQNQTFYIDDSTFSDYFGEGDPNYADDGNIAQRAGSFTRITSDATLVDNVDPEVVVNDRLYWRISRRGLVDPAKENLVNDIDDFIEGQPNYTLNYSAEVSTSNDGSVMIKFGDGVKSAIPYGVITVDYFSTNGENGNLLNVAGTVLKPLGSKITITQGDGTESDIVVGDLNFALTTDIRGGQNIESRDSIKNNASSVFNSLDRLVNRLSYKIFLRRYADIKYATAFGEDILNTKLETGGIDVKYMNQVRFSVLKDLYRERDGKYYPTSSDEYYLQGAKVSGLMHTWEYDYQEVDNTVFNGSLETVIRDIRTNLIDTVGDKSNPFYGTRGDEVETKVNAFVANYLNVLVPTYPLNYKVFSANMTPLDFTETGSELYNVMTALNRRGMITVGNGFHTYVYPSVHDLEVSMDVILYKGHNFTDIKERIKNLLYKYLKDNTEFSTAIYRSKLESIVHSMVEVAGVNVTFAPVNDGFAELDLADLPWMGEMTAEYIVPGDISADGFNYYLSFDANSHGLEVNDAVIECAIPDQSAMASRIGDYYKYKVAPMLETITDRDIDKFVAYIWEQTMQQIYTPLVTMWEDAKAQGDIDDASFYYKIAEQLKTWEMGATSLKFKDSEVISDLRETNGASLYDYMHYSLEYIKLVRRVLKYYIIKNLIDADGNITNYSNDNEIVQLSIPSENINLTVSTESSLLTE